MDSEHWSRIQSIFDAAADLGNEEQRAYIEAVCAGDKALVSEVRTLLAEDARGSPLPKGDVAAFACEILDDASRESPPFKRCGPYRIIRVLGEGGMGVVCLAERSDLGSLVAIKTLRDAWVSRARRERFAGEQRTLARLNHPSIARLYDADTLPDGTPWFAMEYVEGVPLMAFCKTADRPIGERLKLFRCVCEAVQYAHAQGVIHRDLKPSNILVKRDGSVRLLDFGVAKHIDEFGTAMDPTMTGLRFLTPAYAAPEQIRSGMVGIQTDVYSLGVILYELIAGHLPFDLTRRTPTEAVAIITERTPAKPSVAAKRSVREQGANPRVFSASKLSWADLDVLCLTAMHPDPGRRYRSVEGLLRDVDHFLNGEPLAARPDSARYRLQKLVIRNRRAVVVSAAALVLVGGLVAFFTAWLAAARDAAVAQAERTQRVQKLMTNLFQGGDSAAGPDENLRVVTLLDRGIEEARLLNGEPEVQADLYQALGTMYQKLGKLDRANSLLTLALSQRRSLLGVGDPQVAESLTALSRLRDSQAQFSDAERMAREALAIYRRRLPANDPAIAAAMTMLGKVLEDRGRYGVAIEHSTVPCDSNPPKALPVPNSPRVCLSWRASISTPAVTIPRNR